MLAVITAPVFLSSRVCLLVQQVKKKRERNTSKYHWFSESSFVYALLVAMAGQHVCQGPTDR